MWCILHVSVYCVWIILGSQTLAEQSTRSGIWVTGLYLKSMDIFAGINLEARRESLVSCGLMELRPGGLFLRRILERFDKSFLIYPGSGWHWSYTSTVTDWRIDWDRVWNDQLLAECEAGAWACRRMTDGGPAPAQLGESLFGGQPLSKTLACIINGFTRLRGLNQTVCVCSWQLNEFSSCRGPIL